MFAYCNNCPATYTDASGLFPSSGIANPNAMTHGGGGVSGYTDPNDPYRQTAGFIYGQNAFLYANASLGWGTYARNGCGIIATYNALQLLGKPQSLGAIGDEIISMGGLCMMGLMGVDPWIIDDYFAANNIPCTGYLSYSSMAQSLSEGDVLIFLVMNDTGNILAGYHYMAAQYLDDQFIVYNYSNIRTSPKPVSTLDPVYENAGWCYGFVIGG